MNHTTRKYPRSMSEAFPDVRANAITVYKSKSRRAIIFVLALVIALFSLSAYAGQ